ncbi:MAG: hypothetical protein DME33_09295 [Verrucomicrobia bacterium]|nr:MAG: hypothetical protein DME33_09295 [Verrucomicrobiota bacterium]
MIGEREAIMRAQRVLGFDETIMSRAWAVRRLDRPTGSYFLVELGEKNMTGAVATVDRVSGEVTHSARLRGEAHLKTPQELLGGDLRTDVEIKLVWRPCDASRSPLYPLWQIRTDEDLFYLDQNGQRWYRLESTGRGG